MEKDLITVIIPFRNRSEVVYRALDSVYDQEYRPIEVILVDDASVSDLDINKYSIDNDIQIRLLKNEYNVGPGASRGRGRQVASGQFIAYLDSDDYWDKSFLAKLYHRLSQSKELGMAFSNTVKIENNIIVEHRFSQEEVKNIIPNLFNKRYWSTSSCLWRSKVSLAANWYPFRDHEDYLHDFYSASINNNCSAIREELCYKVQDAPERIPRSNREFFKTIISLDILMQSTLSGINNNDKHYVLFVLKKFYKRHIKFRYSEFKLVLNVFKKLLGLLYPTNFRESITVMMFFFFWLFNFRRGLKKMINILGKMSFK